MTPSKGRIGVVAIACLLGCSDGSGTTPLASVRQPVIGGRPSGSQENAAVFIVTAANGTQLRCSGTLVAPNIAMTARHCLLLHRSPSLNCTSDGQLTDPNDPRGQDLRPEDPANVTVRYGANETEYVTAKGSQIFTPTELFICKNDLAFIVLATPLANQHVPLRLEPIALGERFRFSGWGYTGDGQTELPKQRSSLDDLRVAEVGPGLIPAGTFAIGGNATCYGDSGGGAWFGEAVGGAYSRIEGTECSLATSRNVFTMLAPHRALIERAFAAAGATPWYAGEPAPWLAKDGAACTSNDGCRSGICRDGSCTSATTAPAAVAPPANGEPGAQNGCEVSGSVGAPSVAGVVAALTALLAVAKRARESAHR